MHLDRRFVDVFFRRAFAAVSAFSVLALAAIVVFVFAQGAEPFLVPTARNVRLVLERIDAATVDGVDYVDRHTFIELPEGAASAKVSFVNKGSPVDVEIFFDYDDPDPATAVRFGDLGPGTAKYPEAYVHTIAFPGVIAALEQRIHILLPEPPLGLPAFLAGMDWRPTYNKQYGIFPMIVATVLSTLGAVVVGVPIALLAAVFQAEFLPEGVASLIRSGIELLAGIPSVVYGFFGLMVVVPFIKSTFRSASGSSLLAAIVILSIMILPTVVAITETSLRAVPKSYREASLALGASRMQTAWQVVVPPAGSGIVTGVILGISRAVGETMAVILVAGNSSQIPRSLTDGVRTLTSTIALEMGYAQGRHNQVLFSVGIVLFAMIFILNAAILVIRRKAAEAE